MLFSSDFDSNFRSLIKEVGKPGTVSSDFRPNIKIKKWRLFAKEEVPGAEERPQLRGHTATEEMPNGALSVFFAHIAFSYVPESGEADSCVKAAA